MYAKIQTGPIFFFFLAEFGQAGAVPIWTLSLATIPKVMIQARADDLAWSRGRPRGCKDKAKLVKIHGAD